MKWELMRLPRLPKATESHQPSPEEPAVLETEDDAAITADGECEDVDGEQVVRSE